MRTLKSPLFDLHEPVREWLASNMAIYFPCGPDQVVSHRSQPMEPHPPEAVIIAMIGALFCEANRELSPGAAP